MIDERIQCPAGSRPTARLIYGVDVRAGLKMLEDDSVDTVITSPPYWGLRDYDGPEQIWGGKPRCKHDWSDSTRTIEQGNKRKPKDRDRKNPRGQEKGSPKTRVIHCGECLKCGAWRGKLGLEPTPEMFIEHLADIFDEVWRVLKPTGTIWVNLGDSYASNAGGGPGDAIAGDLYERKNRLHRRRATVAGELKHKDLVGIPWSFAFEMRARGWYLRSDVIWAKPNPMPESVVDRPTKSHEYLFLMSKSRRYFYDIEGYAEAATGRAPGNHESKYEDAYAEGAEHLRTKVGLSKIQGRPTRNRRTVWTVSTKPYAGAHFAVFPPELIEPCVLAGSSEHGCCSMCGAPWERRVGHGDIVATGGSATGARASNMAVVSPLGQDPTKSAYNTGEFIQRERVTLGWDPTCACDADKTLPTVLDPFSGTATVGQVCFTHGRNYIGIDLDESNLELARRRLFGRDPKRSKREPEQQVRLFDDPT